MLAYLDCIVQARLLSLTRTANFDHDVINIHRRLGMAPYGLSI